MWNGTQISVKAMELFLAASTERIRLRTLGGVAVWQHCPLHRVKMREKRPRPFRDIDFVAPFHNKQSVESLFRRLGWQLDIDAASSPGRKYSLLYLIDSGNVVCRCDVYYDVLDFCHTIDVSSRLVVDSPTLPLAELLLSKLQIVDQTDVDLFDMYILLAEHEVGEGDDETVNKNNIAERCSRDWGLCTTVLRNLTRLDEDAHGIAALEPEERVVVRSRIQMLSESVRAHEKSFAWRVRSWIGERIQWYNDVEEIGSAVTEPS